VWKGAASTAQVPPAVKLVKAETDVE
jgi:hypothetical protein